MKKNILTAIAMLLMIAYYITLFLGVVNAFRAEFQLSIFYFVLSIIIDKQGELLTDRIK